MQTIYQYAEWPGATLVESCVGTISHGISPAVFVLTTAEQPKPPARRGNLVLGDGLNRVVLRDCKVDSISPRSGGDGDTWSVAILDRRWRWRGGSISGNYNRMDPYGKLVPWSIRSPKELAELCLREMGERNYHLDLPAGLTSAVASLDQLDRYLRLGEFFPQSLTNPHTVWDATPPMVALARLAEQYGCRVVYQPNRDRVWVGPLGKGDPLPDHPLGYESLSLNIDDPETPAGVGVMGAPVRVQMRFLLEPVGEEWDGRYVPIDELSYAPIPAAGLPAKQETRVTWEDADGGGDPEGVHLTLRYQTQFDPPAGPEVDLQFDPFGLVSTPWATIAAALAADVNASAAAEWVTAAVDGSDLVLTGKRDGFPFQVVADHLGDAALGRTVVTLAQGAFVGQGFGAWESSQWPNIQVRATERLSYEEALSLAQKSVFRCYRITLRDPETGRHGLKAPWYGEVVRRQDVVLTDRKVEQVVPQPRFKGGVQQANLPNVAVGNVRRLFGGILPEFYNGVHRDQRATITGSVTAETSVQGILWDGVGQRMNTGRFDRVYVPFSVVPDEQMIVFSRPVYVWWPVAGTNLSVRKPTLVLETAAYLQDAKTGDVRRWRETLPLGGEAPVEWAVREDVNVGVIGLYQEREVGTLRPLSHNLTGQGTEGLEDARGRAAYYLTGMARKYRLVGGETRQYIGVVPVDPDGYTQQVTWSVGNGATTTASANSEHDPVIPDYPERRYAEDLPADKRAAQLNLLEQRMFDLVLPKPGDRVNPQ